MTKDRYSYSKNFQSDSTIKKIYEKNFNKSSENIIITSLTGGTKSAVYLIQDYEEKIVLKISAKQQDKLLSFEKNTICWESQMLRLMETNNISAPRLIKYDDSCEVCDSPYILMSYIEGRTFEECKKKLSEREINDIEYQIGKICSDICKIKGNDFYLPSNPENKYNNNFEFTLNLFNMLLKDAKTKKINIGFLNYNEIIELIIRYEEILNNINNLCLVHSDIWDGNIIIKNGKISGIVDFADLYFCDELMTFYFHTIKPETSKKFLEGFGKESLTFEENVRISVYRLLVLLKMHIESNYKHFENNDWIIDKIYNEVSKLQCVDKKLKLV